MAVQVTKVNLPDRTRNRLEAESNLQRVQKPHDIRSAIPLVDYTNPAKFPPYVFREFPKMPLLDLNRPIVIDESGGVLVFYDAEDEAEFMDMNPEIAEEIERNTPARALSDAIASKDATIEDMRARLRAAGLDDGEKRPKNALARSTRPSVPAAGEAHPEPPEAAASTKAPPPPKTEGVNLPPNNKNPLKSRKN